MPDTVSNHMTPTCPLCHSSSLQLALTAPDYRYGGHTLHQVWRCQGCGLGLSHPPLADSDWITAYPRDYEPYLLSNRPARGLRGRLSATVLASLGYTQPNALPLPAFIVRFMTRMRGWTWLPPPAPPGKLLDVGCGSGAYGASLLRLGWNVDGIEMDRVAAERALRAGLQVQTCRIEEAELPPARYDVITFWHVLEHLEDPVEALRRVRVSLRQGGIVIIEVPNWSGIMARLTGSYWFHLDLPRHRLHFTPFSLGLALHQAGFYISHLQHIPNPHGLAGALSYRRGRRSGNASRPSLALGWATGMLTAALGRSDVIRVVARDTENC